MIDEARSLITEISLSFTVFFVQTISGRRTSIKVGEGEGGVEEPGADG